MRRRITLGEIRNRIESSLKLRSGKVIELTNEGMSVVDRDGQWDFLDLTRIFKVSWMKNTGIIIVHCKNGENWKVDITQINKG